MKKPVIIISTLLVSIMGIGLGVYLVGQRQSLTGKAAPATSLSISPSTSSKAPGASFSLNVIANTGENQVTGIDLIINYNTANVQVDSITKGSGISVFDQEIRKTIDAAGGQIAYSAFTLNKTSAVTGSGITVLTIAGKVKDGATAGSYTFSFGSGNAVAGVSEGQNLLTGSTPGTITVSGSDAIGLSITPTPTGTSSSSTSTVCTNNLSDSFGASSVDTTKWSIYKGTASNGSATTTGGQLVLSDPNDTGANDSVNIQTKGNITGDFVTSIDLISQTGTMSSGYGQQIIVASPDNNLKDRVIVTRKSDNTVTSYYTDGNDTSQGLKNTTAITGTVNMKIEKTAGSIKTYYKTTGDYVLLGDYPNVVGQSAVIRTQVYSNTPFPHVTGNFDNFIFGCVASTGTTAPTSVGSTTKTSTPMPIPSTGTSWPTIGGMVLGGVVIVLSVILAL